MHSDASAADQVVELDGLDEVSVPDHRSVSDLKSGQVSSNIVQLLAALLQDRLVAEHGSMLLHGTLHLVAELVGGHVAVSIADALNTVNAVLTSLLWPLTVGVAGLVGGRNGVGTGTPEDDNVQQRVGAQAVGTMHRGRCSLTSSIEAVHNLILAVDVRHHLTLIVGGDATHVVVHSRQDRNGLLGHIHTGEDGRC